MSQTIITENLDKKELHIVREFNAPIELVWRAWTEPELIDQWWAPRPWKTKTKSMDFRTGGRWLYSMNGPEGEVHWCKADFKNIVIGSMYEGLDGFCDENGVENTEIPVQNWTVRFFGSEDKTRVEVTNSFSTVEALKTIVEMGFKEGFTMAHGNLDELLESLKSAN